MLESDLLRESDSYLERYRSGHNGAVLKTVRVQAHVGSNPTLSAILMTVDLGDYKVIYTEIHDDEDRRVLILLYKEARFFTSYRRGIISR